ncbi:MAG: polysaccharide deacetylase family protein [Candidatus Aureabacteria bacterium]|nr:polysaccharide deacetylase family protein [Candidatus Auribacterota bacterium]
MRKCAFLTLDLEPDHCDLVEGYHYESFEGAGEFLNILRKENAALTVFATGKVLDEKREIVRLFADAGAEVELHAYSHKRTASGTDEIAKGIEAYGRAFGRAPKGYRAPLGMISREEIEFLSKKGFLFDSSLFPSLFPGRFSNASAPTSPFIHPGTRLLELPISVVPVVRFPVSLSYIQLASYPAFRLITTLFGLPPRLVIDLHLHDVFPSSIFRELPLKWKIIYSRLFMRDRNKGVQYFEKVVALLKSKGYEFGRMMDLYAISARELSS